jgi:hypothetical protein
MCRSIKRLRYSDRLPTDEELHEAALQFVRKVSGMRAPSRVNQAAFEQAVVEIQAATQALIGQLPRLPEKRNSAPSI